MYTYPPGKKGSTNSNGLSSRSLFERIMPLQPAATATFSEVLQELLLDKYFETSFGVCLVDQPFSKREFFSH